MHFMKSRPKMPFMCTAVLGYNFVQDCCFFWLADPSFIHDKVLTTVELSCTGCLFGFGSLRLPF